MLNTKDTYEDSRTQVKNSVGFIGKIAVTLGLLQLSSLSPYLPIYLHQITTPLVYAVCRRDDGAGQPTRREYVERKLDELRRAMEERGLKISRNNTEYLHGYNEHQDAEINLLGEKVEIFTTLVDRWKTGCGRQPQSAERREELVDRVWSVVRQGNECEDQ